MPETPDYLKKIMVGVATAVLVASITGSVLLLKEFIQLQEWTLNHDRVAQIYISQISHLNKEAAKGNRWSRENHEAYVKEQNQINQDHDTRIHALERHKDVTEYRLESIDSKLDQILKKLK